jgi:8-oxo-dGTP pyrophosphatase MutT (NUDIX family)
MERHQTIRAYAAGGVVFRLVPLSPTEEFGLPAWYSEEQWGETLAEVALVGKSEIGIWALPKGTPEAGETLEQVAVREVQEETGLEVRLISYIGSISYSFIQEQVRYHKQVRHFLFEAVGGDLALHDHEYDLVKWFPLPEAYRHLTYQNEINILSQAEDVLQRWLEYQQQEGPK